MNDLTPFDTFIFIKYLRALIQIEKETDKKIFIINLHNTVQFFVHFQFQTCISHFNYSSLIYDTM